jgi:hypothetical protein
VLVAIGIMVAVLANRDTASSPSAGSLVPPSSIGRDDPEAQALLALLAKGRDQTFHAAYAVQEAPSYGPTHLLRLETWRKGGRVRQDSIITGTSSSRTETFVLEGQTVLCVQLDADPFTCTPSSDSAAAGGVFGDLSGDLTGLDVTASDDTIDGKPVRCFAYSRENSAVRVCVTSEGIPVQQSIDDQQITLATIDPSVDDTVFALPAPLTTTTTTG